LTDSLGESHCKPFSSLEQGLAITSNNDSPFERELLDYSWAVEETECLTMNHQVIV
jgi:hypothetical protein